ncbi:hypothetical protein [Nonomuraea sp. NPDC046570]|uniref:hypothetical protein n=1 Tax=Nonomuraea sp. NPDC046570 TaxID=3155255 RepID=UPI0033E91FC3
MNRSLSVVAALAVAVAGLAVPASASAVAPCRFGIRDDQIRIRYDYLGGRPVLGCPVEESQETFEPPGRRQTFDYGQIAFSYVGGKIMVLSVSYLRLNRKIKFLFGRAFQGGRFVMRVWANGVPRIPSVRQMSPSKPLGVLEIDGVSGKRYRFDVRADVCGAQGPEVCKPGTLREPYAWAEWTYRIKIDDH